MNFRDKFQLGQLVKVNTGGNATLAIIDYPTIRKDNQGKERDYFFNNAFLCRLTSDFAKTYAGGAIQTNEDLPNRLCCNAQYIPHEFITDATI